MGAAQQPEHHHLAGPPPAADRPGYATRYPGAAEASGLPLLSVTEAARRLGVSRWTVWRMIADGELDAETIMRGGRVLTRVRLPQPLPDDAGAPPRSRTAQLQEQVDRLTKTLERLTTLLQEANRDRAALQEALRRREGEADAGAGEAELLRPLVPPVPPTASPQTERPSTPPGLGRILGGLRPNPMTHPASALPRSRPMRREELLEPVRELFRTRRRTWWQRIPLLSRG